MNAMSIAPRVGPCDSPRRIGEWVDKLLEMRLEFRDHLDTVREIDRHLRLAAGWLGAWKAGRRCA